VADRRADGRGPSRIHGWTRRRKIALNQLVAGAIRFDAVIEETMRESGKLLVCGPDGPFLAMQECAKTFSPGQVELLKSDPAHWVEVRKQEGVDIFYGVAEAMLSDFDEENPGFLDPQTIVNLWGRRVGILVREGNPLEINMLADLWRSEARLLDVQHEKMGRFQELALGPHPKFALSVLTGEEGKEAWLSATNLDAWITYYSWHVALDGKSVFIPIRDEDDTLRFTPAGIVQDTRNRPFAEAFLKYLRTPEAHAIFAQHGWE
jgi:accessory colonization factor AcfC